MRSSGRHWWLAIFKIGVFSNPRDLTMDISIKFKDKEMLNAFIKTFKKLRHNKNSYSTNDLTFHFKYKKAKTRKVFTRSLIADSIRQHYNKKNVFLYNKLLADVVDNDGMDDSKYIREKKLIFLNKYIPNIIKNSDEVDVKTLHNKEFNSVIYLDDSVFSKMRGNHYE